MLKCLFLAILLCGATVPAALSQPEFFYTFDQLQADTRYAATTKMAAAPDGGWAMAECDSATHLIRVLRFEACGELRWAKQIDCGSVLRPYRVGGLFFDTDGHLLLGANGYSNNAGAFYLMKIGPDGALIWDRSWGANQYGPGVFALGRLPDGRYFFTGTCHPPPGPTDLVGLLDTAGQLLSLRRYFRSSAGYQTVGTALRNGHLLLRRGPWLYEIDPDAAGVIWSNALIAPLYNSVLPVELDTGFLVLGQFANSVDRYSALPVFLTPGGQFGSAGQMFRANGGILTNLPNLEIRRVEPLPDGNFVTLTTDSLPVGLLTLVVFSPAGELLRQIRINPAPDTLHLFNHDFCRLTDGSLAVAANANGRLALFKIRLDSTEICGAREHPDPVPYQTSYQNTVMTIQPDTFQFEVLSPPVMVTALDPGLVRRCVTSPELPDRSTVLKGCSGDTLWADATALNAAVYQWENGADSARVRILPGEEREVRVTTGCRSYRHRFEVRLRDDCPCPLSAPNAFTPDGDGMNDAFRPESACGFSRYELQVFNRWGREVYAGTGPDARWDGRVQGAEAPSDTYVFVLRYALATGFVETRVLKGDLVLLR